MAGTIDSSVYMSTRSDGRLERPVQTAAVWAPKFVELSGDYLIFDADQQVSRKSGTGILQEFLDLAEQDAVHVAAFARKWGALHNGARDSIAGLKFRESIDSWRQKSAQLAALQSIGAELNSGRVPHLDDGSASGLSLTEARFQFMRQMRLLIAESRLQPRFSWNGKLAQWQIDLDSDGRSNVLAVLTMQLMIQVADKDGYALCSNCKRSYIPGRRPTPTKRNYCDRVECKKAAWRDSKRRIRSAEKGN